MLLAAAPCWSALPNTTSSTSAGSIFARATASRSESAPRVGALVLLNAPRTAFPIGVRAVETMTALRMMVTPGKGLATDCPAGCPRGLIASLVYRRLRD